MRPADVAARLGVDPKTVERWLVGRLPYPRHRASLMRLTGWSEPDLWPQLARPSQPGAEHDEVVITYPHRSTVPVDAWHHLLDGAQREICVLAYSGLFLAEDTVAHRLIRDKARAGTRVRIALGDLSGRQVAQRGADEGIDDVMSVRIHNALLLFRALAGEPGVEVRVHDTILYNSIYRADDDLLVNTHIYGCPASHAPVLHLRRKSSDGMVSTYVDSFERVWAAARDSEL
jgi:hypothetical protein